MLPRKLIGEIVELRFMLHATELGYAASRPWGDSRPYDIVVEGAGPTRHAPHIISRVQVKSSSTLHQPEYGGWWKFSTQRRTTHGIHLDYTAEDIDFFALYAIPVQLWFIVPFAQAEGRKHICVRANGTGIHGQSLNAWELFGLPLYPIGDCLRPTWSASLPVIGSAGVSAGVAGALS